MLTAEQLIVLHHALLHGAKICTDSRIATPGSIFFALKGDTFDGNAFASSALEKGSAFAVVETTRFPENKQFIIVKDVLAALHQLTRYHRECLTIPVVGITGSNGKTTTKELISRVLSKAFATRATEGNLNNHIGVPLTILSLDTNVEMAVVEMGANHLGEIDQLCKLANPDYGIITNLGKAHLEGFGSFENIVKAKTELYKHVAKNQGVLFVPGDNDILFNLSGQTNRVTYGQQQKNDCVGVISGEHPFISLEFYVQNNFGKAVQGTCGQLSSQLYGIYNFDNIMAAITIGLYFGINPQQVAEAISAYNPENNRSQVLQTRKNTVILDAYNANPSSMAAALTHFSAFIKDHQTTIMLGDMFELGQYARKEHQDICSMSRQWPFSQYIFVGKQFASVVEQTENTFVFDNVQDASVWLQNNPITDHHILIKGSRAVKMENLVEFL